ncbi:MAG: acyl-CoA thioesterase [Flavobacteriaceae bacterium]
MERYEKTIVVAQGDLDELAHVNNVRYVQWMQDIAQEHWQAVAPPHMQRQLLWVVKEHRITYLGAAQLHDRIRVGTHIGGSKGALSQRVIQMTLENEEATPLLTAVTDWCCLDATTRRPIRIPKEVIDLFGPQP